MPLAYSTCVGSGRTHFWLFSSVFTNYQRFYRTTTISIFLFLFVSIKNLVRDFAARMQHICRDSAGPFLAFVSMNPQTLLGAKFPYLRQSRKHAESRVGIESPCALQDPLRRRAHETEPNRRGENKTESPRAFPRYGATGFKLSQIHFRPETCSSPEQIWGIWNLLTS